MKRMGIEAIYRKPNTSKPAPGHKIYPYLLRNLPVIRPNQVWAMDLTYIPMARGFVDLAAVIDWFSRRVLAWRLSITMEAEFCIEALEEALARHGRPEIFNSDQGSQFTSASFTDVVLNAGIAISMDGKGSWRDNVFIERLWRSVKYEEVYLSAYESVAEARSAIGGYFGCYNTHRPHSSLERRTPDRAYFNWLPRIVRHEPGRRSTYQTEIPVQTNPASSVRFRWCAIVVMTTRCRLSMAIAKCWSAATCMRWRSLAVPRRSRVIRAPTRRKTSATIRCITWRC